MGKDACTSSLNVDCESPRAVTRGWDSQTERQRPADVVGLHWLRGSIDQTEKTWLTEKLCTLWGGDFETHEHGFWVYDRHLAWPSGVKLLYHSTEQGSDLTNGRIALEIPGAALEQLDTFQVVFFMDSLERRGFGCSRLDVFFDDNLRTVTPMALYNEVYEESLFEGEPIRHDIIGFRVVKKLTESTREGRKHDEVSFGRRGKTGTGKYLRIYDKRLESKGENPAVRWELELSDNHAKAAFRQIVKSIEAAGVTNWKPEFTTRVLGGFLAKAVDFKIREPGVKNLSRLERYPFWTKILSRLGSATLAVKRIIKTIEKAREWVGRQVTGTLQMLVQALSPEVALPMILDWAGSENRLRPSHLRAISEYRRQEPRDPLPEPA
ncbi:MAG: hypothetical protein EHM35_14490 [Planctomycetaceae bacterium]|nr:MAG: hypothetical protein EHM35_14490 [Planctomycetaceae bacterium]